MDQSKRTFSRLPIVGSILFLLLYIIAASLYPGGCQHNPNSIGFSWVHNYWCNLLNVCAINGKLNTARPFALLGNFVLGLSMSSFYWQFPNQFPLTTATKLVIRISGIVSMILASLLFTNIDHDFLTNLTSAFGLIATLFILMVLYQNKLKLFFYAGIATLFLVLVNLLFYHSPTLILYLPLVQKFTFLFFLSWISCICLHFSSFPKK